MHKVECDIPSKKVIVHVFIATFDGREDMLIRNTWTATSVRKESRARVLSSNEHHTRKGLIGSEKGQPHKPPRRGLCGSQFVLQLIVWCAGGGGALSRPAHGQSIWMG